MKNKKSTKIETPTTAVVKSKSNLAKEVIKYLENKENDVVVQHIEDATAKLRGKISDRKLDFAQRYALEPRTAQYWANYYSTSKFTIKNWLDDPRVRQLINEIKCDVNKLYTAKMLYLREEAARVYHEILSLPLTRQNRYIMKEAADKIMEITSTGDDGSNNNFRQPAVSVNFIGAEGNVMPQSSNEQLKINIKGVRANNPVEDIDDDDR